MRKIDLGAVLDPLAGSRIVVTGGAGFIGSHVATRLARSGAEVKVIDDLSTGRLDKLADARTLGLGDSDIRIADVRSQECADAIADWKPAVVVHLAAQASLPAALRSPVTDADINIRGTVNVLEASLQAGVGLIVYAASSAIYGQVPVAHLPVSEQTPIAPTSPYGMSKAAGLHYVNWYQRQHQLQSTALSLGNVYGPRQFGLNCGVIPQLVHDVAAGIQPSVSGDGQQTRDFVYVTDVADAVALACARTGLGLINIASGIETSIAQIFDTVCRRTGKSVAPNPIPAVAGEARRMVFDIQRARDVLGWCPFVELSAGIGYLLDEARNTSRVSA
ncbi:NAD-dependent epimerase/dehydratase family protein [Nocardia goodfellowii]